MKRSTLTLLIVFGVLIVDQVIKIWVKTNMTFGEEFGILGLSWARIHFVENDGMAFGISFGGSAGKLALSVFRLLAVGFLIYIIRSLIQAKESKALIACFALILAGAIGNILDSAFYGLIFSASSYHGPVAEMFPEGGGYAKFLYGHVVDMFYFPMIDMIMPEWVPVIGGDRFQFFKPVFNMADSAISVGVISMLLFHRKFLRTGTTKDEVEGDSTSGESTENTGGVDAAVATNVATPVVSSVQGDSASDPDGVSGSLEEE